MDKEIGKLVINIEARLDNLEKGLKTAEAKVNSSNQKLISSFKSLSGVLGVTFGTAAVIGFAKKSIDAYAEQEKANKKLEIALGRTSNKLLQYADSLQKTTTFADEQIVEAQALIAMFVKDEDQIKALTKATLDLSAAKGMDLSSAADLVAKSVGSSTNALARYGIKISDIQDPTKRATELIAELNKKFGGQAAGQLDTYAGKIKNLENRFDEMLEKWGEKLVPAVTQVGEEIFWVVDKIDQAFNTTWQKLSDDYEAFMRLIGQNGKPLAETTKGLKSDRKSVENLFNKNKTEKPTELTPEEKKALEERAAKQAEFYNTVKFLSDKYYTWQLAQIEKEKKEYIAAGISKVDAQKLADQKLFELEIDRFNKFQDIQPKGLETIPFTMSTPNVTEQLKADYQLKLDLETEFQQKLLEIREDAQITQLELMDSAYDSMARGFDSAFNKMLLIESQSNNILVQGFTSMANSFISEVSRMIAKWISFQIIKGIFGAVLAPFTGGASAVAAVAGVAGGGERVVVNPGLEYGGIDRNDVQSIVTVIKAMNMNLANRLDNVGVTVINNAPDVRTTVIRNKKIENRMTNEGKNLSE